MRTTTTTTTTTNNNNNNNDNTKARTFILATKLIVELDFKFISKLHVASCRSPN
jgi:hypothetical protein